MKHLTITLLTSLTLSILLLFAGCSDEKAKYPEGKKWGEILMEESVNFEMLPLQPPSDNPPETAKGLMRCLQLYTTYFLITLEACGFNDWKKKNNSGHKGFVESKQFKECRSYEDHKLRDEYSLKFMQEAHNIAFAEGFAKEKLFLHNDKHIDAYYEMMQEMFDISARDLSFEERIQEMEKIPLSADLTTCMDYRDYVDLEKFPKP